MFITLEGGEGCGKTSQVLLLKKFFNSIEVPYTVIRDPGSDPIAEDIRKILVCGSPEKMDTTTEFLLYLAARRQIIVNAIRPELAKGKVVICDRFFDSTCVYQCYCKGISMLDFHRGNSIIGNIEPNVTFLLDVIPKIGLERSKRVNKETDNKEDRWESMDLSFHEKVRDGYIELANKNTKRIKVIDTNKYDKHMVSAIIIDYLKKFIPEVVIYNQ